MKLTLPDGDELEVEEGKRVIDIAYDIGPGLGDATVGATLDGELLDLRDEIHEEGEFEIITIDSPQAVEIIRHTASHVMAQAVKRLYDDVRLAIGPAIDDGFYYDFDLSETLSEDDFDEIRDEMRKIVDEGYEIERFALDADEAKEYLAEQNEDYKLELLDEFVSEGEESVTFYRQDGFTDLCEGPHLRNTEQLEHFELLDVAGAYWRGDETNVMLQRVYGTAFTEEKELKEYIERQEEAKERDHRKLGPELDLFTFHPEVGPGLVYWHPKGTEMLNVIKDFWREKHREDGYEFVSTPHIGKSDLWKKSGHLDYFREDMFPPMKESNQEYFLKPMNCPFHVQIYQSRTRSYRDLPLRWAELGTVYRHERSGVLHGLLRARGFTQDDAHIIATPDQVKEEVTGVLDLTFDILSAFGFDDYEIALSTKPEKSVGDEDKWEKATEALKEAIVDLDLDYVVEEGEGAFYGPKIDVHLEDALGRLWQTTTVQFDFNLPERFDMTYMGSDGREHRPYMIHRALLGTLERFFGILIEHYKGAFPVWLAPVQVAVLPVTGDNHEYAEEVAGKIAEAGIRVDARTDVDENLSRQIHEAQMENIPYMLVVGDNEEESGEVSLRLRTEEDLGPRPLDEFIEFAEEKIESKALI
uniref:threonine--tRNA ligase n=1 Tax=uncultured organism TaxID=155900 RepID=M1P0M0_9ZZZZ|nr:threonyl-tRNA synthetase [uncultured organism]